MSREERDHAVKGEDAAAPRAGDPGDGSVAASSASTGEGGATGSGSDHGSLPGDSSVAELEVRLRQLEEENSVLKDQYLRKAADFENYRKRMIKEREENAKFANANLLLDLIPVIDDFERAIRSSAESQDFATFHTGIVLIEKQLVEMLDRKYALKRYESAGQVFDPERHEAISVAEIPPPADERIVLEDYQKGFTLHDRILRTAKVKVSLEPGAKQSEKKADEGAGNAAVSSVNGDDARRKEGDQ